MPTKKEITKEGDSLIRENAIIKRSKSDFSSNGNLPSCFNDDDDEDDKKSSIKKEIGTNEEKVSIDSNIHITNEEKKLSTKKNNSSDFFKLYFKSNIQNKERVCITVPKELHLKIKRIITIAELTSENDPNLNISINNYITNILNEHFILAKEALAKIANQRIEI